MVFGGRGGIGVDRGVDGLMAVVNKLRGGHGGCGDKSGFDSLGVRGFGKDSY